MAKRSDYISWNEYFMGVAILAAQRSKDPIHKLVHVLLVMIIKSCPLVIMVCL